MVQITLPRIGTYAAWRDEARRLAEQGVPPEDVVWSRGDSTPGLFDAAPLAQATPREIRVPKTFLGMARAVAAHSDPERFALLYSALVRLQNSPRLLSDRSDRTIQRLRILEKAVHRDQHKMKAFLRFRELKTAPRRSFVAWFEPTHFIMENMVSFFENRFASMDFLIVTPDISMRFTDGRTTLEDGVPRPPELEDGAEELWKTYFANIFNPARLKISAMQSEMPKKYWKNLPEAELIPGLIADARAREQKMQASAPTAPNIKAAHWRYEQETLQDLNAAMSGCDRCPLAGPATQVVPGEGPSAAQLMIVGEQPGDQEDLAGRPFVGPAGQLFDEVARDVGLNRAAAYVTNAVKHFKFQPRGKQRIHQRPNSGEVHHCRWWLEREIAVVQPELILAVGAVALESLTGDGKGILKRRGKLEASRTGPPVFVTMHPSFLLRLKTSTERESAERLFAQDLAKVAALLAAMPASVP